MHESLVLAKRLDWIQNARSKQLPPDGDWDVWFAMAGRGFGKTRLGAEDARDFCTTFANVRYAIVAPTQMDLRKTCFEGESGLINVIPPELV